MIKQRMNLGEKSIAKRCTAFFSKKLFALFLPLSYKRHKCHLEETFLVNWQSFNFSLN